MAAARAPADFAPNPKPAAGRLEWQQKTDSVTLLQGGQIVWQFNYGTDQSKPSFHPVAVPGGPVLTGFRPQDHPWHRGLWFSWKFINGVNYWEEDPKTGAAQGKTLWRDVRVETHPDFSARIVLDLDYSPAEGQKLLTEHRVIAISAPDCNRTYQMDWSMAFGAVTNVVLDRTPLPGENGGQSWGGYAGLSIRFAQELREAEVAASSGPVAFAEGRFRGPARGMDFSGRLGQDTFGITVLDSPGNLNSPSPWYAINDGTMCFFSPAVLCYGAKSFSAGQNFTLNYRVIVHPGRWTADQVRLAGEVY